LHITLPTPPRPALFPYTTLFRSQPRSRVSEIVQCEHCMRILGSSVTRCIPGDEIEDIAQCCELWTKGQAVGADAVQQKQFLFARSEEHTSELQSRENLVCRLLLE